MTDIRKVLDHFNVLPTHTLGDKLGQWRNAVAWAIMNRKVRAVETWTADSGDDQDPGALGADSPPLVALNQANIVTSEGADDSLMGARYHLPVLDVDVPCVLVPSTQPGHWHLYIDQAVEEGAYFAMLDALADAGIVQTPWVTASKNRGYSAVRLPWVKKEAVA